MPRDNQIGGWLCAPEKKAFENYLRQFAIRPTAAATLLIVRELRCKRLPRLRTRYEDSPGPDRKRVTAHQTNGRLKSEFNEHVRSFGIDPDPAASILFRAELDERWLEKSVLMESS
jgi:hypothetical protein